MSTPFVPFLPSRIPGATDGAVGSTFQPMGPTPAAPADLPAPVSSPTAAPSAPCSTPAITLRREGDRLTHVHIRCTCGQVLDLECVYAALPVPSDQS